MNRNEQFFYDHAGWSHDPKTETSEQGRERCARALAKAEDDGRNAGLSFEWSADHDCERTRRNAEMWQCACYDVHGRVVASLGGVDFGPEGLHGDPYRRVVEAELALEAIA